MPIFAALLVILASYLPAYAEDKATEQLGKAEFVAGKQTTRGYITHRIEPAPGGAYLTVQVVQDRTHAPVRLLLAKDATAYGRPRKAWELTRGVSNPSGYRTRYEFYLDYDKLGVQPQSTMVVLARFRGGHRWGGTDRGGLITLPRPANGPSTSSPTNSEQKMPRFGEGKPVSSLDVAQPISDSLAEEFAPLRGRGGLEVGGQVRSRVEAEGKFQLSEATFLEARQKLFELAEDRALAREVLGPEWKIALQERYLKKNRAGQLLKDDNGFPVPDPMVDTYYDTENLDAAKHDIAIRYRWTAGNQTGAWNFKPGLGRQSKDGIVYRVEYGVDTVDDRPSSIEPFANSHHPLNPFQLLRAIAPNTTPGQFFHPALVITDTRYKFVLSHKSGIAIEVSLDEVVAEKLARQIASAKKVTFYQLEMDVEHVATESNNVATSSSSKPTALLHVPSAVAASSATVKTQKATFDTASGAIISLRDHLLGKDWEPGAQKYAFAAAALGMVRPKNASTSVKTLGFEKTGCKDLFARLR